MRAVANRRAVASCVSLLAVSLIPTTIPSIVVGQDVASSIVIGRDVMPSIVIAPDVLIAQAEEGTVLTEESVGDPATNGASAGPQSVCYWCVQPGGHPDNTCPFRCMSQENGNGNGSGSGSLAGGDPESRCRGVAGFCPSPWGTTCAACEDEGGPDRAAALALGPDGSAHVERDLRDWIVSDPSSGDHAGPGKTFGCSTCSGAIVARIYDQEVIAHVRMETRVIEL